LSAHPHFGDSISTAARWLVFGIETIDICENCNRVLAVDNEVIQCAIVDTASQDDFAPMRTSYTPHGKGFMTVDAIDDRASFDEVEAFHRDLTRTKGTSNVPCVTSKTSKSKLNAIVVETSALANINIENAFKALVKADNHQERRRPRAVMDYTAEKEGGCSLPETSRMK
jgi:GTPase SAR1 family protein